MLSIAICDDERMECVGIEARIKAAIRELNIPYKIRQFSGGKELLQQLERFDIVFLDILMEDLDGMETARLLHEKQPGSLLVFVTSSRKYVFEAYDVEAFQYLVKPVEDGKLRSVLRRAVEKIENIGKSEQGFLVVSKGGQKEKLFLDDIYYFEIIGRMIYAHGKEGIRSFYEQIGVLEKCLHGKGFFRCHKSFLVNLGHVITYNRQEAVLDNGEKIVIAKRRQEAFGEEILRYMRKNGGVL